MAVDLINWAYKDVESAWTEALGDLEAVEERADEDDAYRKQQALRDFKEMDVIVVFVSQQSGQSRATRHTGRGGMAAKTWPRL